jgi:hypothetical protein
MSKGNNARTSNYIFGECDARNSWFDRLGVTTVFGRWPALKPWTVEAGLITPPLKPKRQAIQARYAAEIEELYRGH